MDALRLISQDSLKEEAPVIEIGDTVKVSVRVREGEKSRIQIFEGTVIARKGSGVSETFTVRRVSY
ncbi:MAG: 50S ribosomal protein L19, partial [Clostridia bacterium]|nr:50S ribosomal protein L19 [Clostridia bacterium]